MADLGEHWAYREGKGKPLRQAEIVQLGPPRSRKARIRFVDGEFAGLDEWVPTRRLLVPWAEAAAFHHDEVRWEAVVAASQAANPSQIELLAAELISFAYPLADGLLASPMDFGACTGTDPQVLQISLGVSPDELFADPLAYVSRFGTYCAPWTTTRRLVRRICEVFSDAVVQRLAEREAWHQEHLTQARYESRGRDDRRLTEYWSALYEEAKPAFALVRDWCGSDSIVRYDELVAVREYSDRLHAALETAIRYLEERGAEREVNLLRSQVGWATEDRRRRSRKRDASG